VDQDVNGRSVVGGHRLGIFSKNGAFLNVALPFFMLTEPLTNQWSSQKWGRPLSGASPFFFRLQRRETPVLIKVRGWSA
jgi:hypothetical protein